MKAGITWDRKYAIQARRAFTAGVHRSDHIIGDNIVRDSLGYFPESLVPSLWYYHFHNTINHNGEQDALRDEDKFHNLHAPHISVPPETDRR